MSGPSIALARSSEGSPARLRDDRGTAWIGSHPAWASPRFDEAPRHGCNVVRRITDDRGREWRVRQLWSEICHGLLFQCTVRGVRSEVRPVRGHLESLTDEELLLTLGSDDD